MTTFYQNTSNFVYYIQVNPFVYALGELDDERSIVMQPLGEVGFRFRLLIERGPALRWSKP